MGVTLEFSEFRHVKGFAEKHFFELLQPNCTVCVKIVLHVSEVFIWAGYVCAHTVVEVGERLDHCYWCFIIKNLECNLILSQVCSTKLDYNIRWLVFACSSHTVCFPLLWWLISYCLNISSEESSETVKGASYILIGVGSLSMVMGFFGWIGAICEIRCMLGLVRNRLFLTC